jgi:heme-degrading monooxygenase HmoA
LAIGAVFSINGVTQAQYEQVFQKVSPNGQMPAGMLFHVAGPTESGWCVVEIWESQDAVQRFFETTLHSALEQAGIPTDPPTVSFQVHNMRQAP